ncbi:MAG: hypothetical protein ACYDD4_11885 [Acidimicrobiales bacterium]
MSVDRLLDRLVRYGWRRARRGQTVWAAVGVAGWMVKRYRARDRDVVWRGKVGAGEQLVVTTRASGSD